MGTYFRYYAHVAHHLDNIMRTDTRKTAVSLTLLTLLLGATAVLLYLPPI
jgi:hypothetical protein